MERTIKERIQEYLEYKGVTPTASERRLNWGVGAFTKAKSITVDRAKEFLLLFEDLSAEWLFRGEGKMLKSSSTIGDLPLLDLEKENIALRAENRLLRELNGLGERKDGSESA